ncbi:MAG: hypothetical protein IJW00_01455 [Clostridia bacterium]|nr:hypothetical protein [Clostridia bacterium]
MALKDLANVEKHNNHEYTPEESAKLQSEINLDLKHLNRHYIIKDGELVEISGYLDLVEIVKQIYERTFQDAIDKYNEKMENEGTPHKKIESYIEKVSANRCQQIAVEGLIQIGDFTDWKDQTFEKRMLICKILLYILIETIKGLKGPNYEFILAGASLHQDENCPHIHYVGVPVEYTPDASDGLACRNKKSAVFNEITMGTILQGEVRDKAEVAVREVFGWEFKEKKVGRNEDYEKNVYINERIKMEIAEKEAILSELILALNARQEEKSKLFGEIEDLNVQIDSMGNYLDQLRVQIEAAERDEKEWCRRLKQMVEEVDAYEKPLADIKKYLNHFTLDLEWHPELKTFNEKVNFFEEKASNALKLAELIPSHRRNKAQEFLNDLVGCLQFTRELIKNNRQAINSHREISDDCKETKRRLEEIIEQVEKKKQEKEEDLWEETLGNGEQRKRRLDEIITQAKKKKQEKEK